MSSSTFQSLLPVSIVTSSSEANQVTLVILHPSTLSNKTLQKLKKIPSPLHPQTKKIKKQPIISQVL